MRDERLGVAEIFLRDALSDALLEAGGPVVFLSANLARTSGVYANRGYRWALIEVGASAGLCLLPDRYGYDYGGRMVGTVDGTAPVFRCDADAATPVPGAVRAAAAAIWASEHCPTPASLPSRPSGRVVSITLSGWEPAARARLKTKGL